MRLQILINGRILLPSAFKKFLLDDFTKKMYLTQNLSLNKYVNYVNNHVIKFVHLLD